MRRVNIFHTAATFIFACTGPKPDILDDLALLKLDTERQAYQAERWKTEKRRKKINMRKKVLEREGSER